jgi:hypothetical protein
VRLKGRREKSWVLVNKAGAAWTQAWTPGNFREAVRADAPTTGWATSYWVGLWLIIHKITLKSNWPGLLGTGILG